MECVCRTCLRIIGTEYPVTYLNQTKHDLDSVTFRQKLEACVPELTVDIVLDPTMCSTCIAGLSLAYQFKNTCLETEKTLFKCIRRRQNSTSCTDLLNTPDLLRIARKDINEEHSYSFVEKSNDYISDSCSDDEFSLKLPSIVQSSLGEFVEQVQKSKTSTPRKIDPEALEAMETTVKSGKTRKNAKQAKQNVGKKTHWRKITKSAAAEKVSPKRIESKPKALKNKEPKANIKEKKQSEVIVKKTRKSNEAKLHRDDKQNEVKVTKDQDAKVATPTKLRDGGDDERKKSTGITEVPKKAPSLGSFSDMASPASSTKVFVQELISDLELEVASTVAVETANEKDDSCSKVASEKPLENNTKRKQRKQARPKKKLQQEFNKEDDVTKIVSYPRPSKAPQRFNNESKQSNAKDDNQNAKKHVVADSPREEDSPKRRTVENKVESVALPEETVNENIPELQDSNGAEPLKESPLPAKKIPKKDVPVLTNVDGNILFSEYDIPQIREQVVVRSDIIESLNPIWYTSDTKRYQCTKCSKGYDYKCHFDVHLKSHIFKKLYSCPICDKSFTQEKYLKTHAMIHTKTGTYECEVCHKVLSASTALKRHIRTHTGEKPYPCFVCNKRFAQKIQLAVHMRTHTGFRPFSCNTCSASFTQKSHLLGHIRIHTGEKPFVCDICPKKFRKSYALQIHKESHSQKPFQCKGCNHLFKDRSSYQKHVNKQLLNCVRGRALLRPKQRSAKRHTLDDLEQDIKDINMAIDYNFVKDDFRKSHLFYCSACNRGFSTKFSRNRHMRVHVKTDA